MPPDDIRLSKALASYWIFTAKAELGSGLCALLWGLLSFTDQTPLEARPALVFMTQLASDPVWEVCAVAVGAWQILSVAFDSYVSRFACASVMSWLLWELTLSYAVSSVARPSIAFPIAFLVINLATVSRYSLYIAWKVRHPAKQDGRGG